MKHTLGIMGYQGLRGPGLHADCFVLGNCSCLGTGREVPCTVQMRDWSLEGWLKLTWQTKLGPQTRTSDSILLLCDLRGPPACPLNMVSDLAGEYLTFLIRRILFI